MRRQPKITPRMAGELVPKRNSDIWRDRQDGGVLVISDARLRIDTTEFNAFGASVWHLCDGTRSVAEIATELMRNPALTFPEDRVVISDVCRFLSELQKLWLVTVRETAPADFLLVVPPFPSCYSPDAIKVAEYSSPPLGLGYLAAVLLEDGHTVAVADMHIDAMQPTDIVRLMERHRPRFLGISSSTPTFPNAMRVARFAKAFRPDVVVCMGGIHPSALPAETLADPAVDIVVRGEGEQTIRELGRMLSGGDFCVPTEPIPGLSLRTRAGDIRHGHDRPFIKDLDSLPLPARHLVDLKKYQQPGAMISSRGCPAQCIFCSCGAFAGRSWRARSPESVVGEMRYLAKQLRIRRMSFHDDTFNLDEQRAVSICHALIGEGLGAEWDCLVRVKPFSPNLARLMRDAGCCGVQFSVESGNDNVLRSIGKGIALVDAENAVRAAAEAGIPQISCGFMIGHPTDTAGTIADTIAFAERLRELGATTLTLSLVTPYPGTELRNRAADMGVTVLSNRWEDYVFSRIVSRPREVPERVLRSLYLEGILRLGDRALAAERQDSGMLTGADHGG